MTWSTDETSSLVLAPSRQADPDTFESGSYAYVFADRPVRKNGTLVTPSPIVKLSVDGAISFDLVPNEEVDDGADFRYVVAAYDENNLLIFKVSVCMPSVDAYMWDLIAIPFDLDTDDIPSNRYNDCVGVEDLTPVETITETVVETFSEAASFFNAYHMASPDILDLNDFILELTDNSSYQFQVRLNDGDAQHDIRIYRTSLDFQLISTFEGMGEFINSFVQVVAPDEVILSHDGSRFYLTSINTSNVSAKIHDHNTEYGGTLTKFDVTMGFTQGAFGALATGSINPDAGVVSGIAVVSPMGVRGLVPSPGVAGDFTFTVSGQDTTVSISLPEGTAYHEACGIIQDAVSGSVCWYDGQQVRFAMDFLEGIATTDVSTYMQLNAGVAGITT